MILALSAIFILLLVARGAVVDFAGSREVISGWFAKLIDIAVIAIADELLLLC